MNGRFLDASFWQTIAQNLEIALERQIISPVCKQMIKKPFLSDDDFGPILIGKMSKTAQKGQKGTFAIVFLLLPDFRVNGTFPEHCNVLDKAVLMYSVYVESISCF